LLQRSGPSKRKSTQKGKKHKESTETKNKDTRNTKA
jgi:hypothetical protein